MSLQSYFIQKQRNKVKRVLQKKHPTLFGKRMELEVDKIIGVVDTGKMDWAALVNIIHTTEQSQYPTPESITSEVLKGVADEFKVRPYILYWFFLQKLEKLQANGRKKHDYLSVLRGCVSYAAKKTLVDGEKRSAAIVYAKNILNIELTLGKADTMIFTGEL